METKIHLFKVSILLKMIVHNNDRIPWVQIQHTMYVLALDTLIASDTAKSAIKSHLGESYNCYEFVSIAASRQFDECHQPGFPVFVTSSDMNVKIDGLELT